MKKLDFLFVVVFTLFLNACISSPTQSVLFTYTDQHMYGLSHGNQIGSGSVSKFGKSCSFSSWFLYLHVFYYGGGGSIEEAVQDGGIKNIAVVDRESLSILGPIFYRECVVVWGD
ncbi:MAG: hypothetical protein H7A23_22810 [Leptospiraceae bacterium]|nr:hypothetical protein [Leptospiraceae bacterium]MCP5497396.1 hypothetical protein [Leptospiraceae bacterium]